MDKRNRQQQATHKARKAANKSPAPNVPLQKLRTDVKQQGHNLARYSQPHHLISKKELPASFEALVRELQLSHNHHLAKRAEAAGKTFEQCLGQLAADLDIVLDGAYTPEDLYKLFGILVERLRVRKDNPNPVYEAKGDLVPVELVETENELLLEEVGKGLGTIGPKAGDGPYTVCNACATTFECCYNRNCSLGKPVTQLGNTVPESVKALSALVGLGEIKH